MRVKENSSKELDEINSNDSQSYVEKASEGIKLAEPLLSLFDIRVSILDLNYEVIYASSNSEKVIGYTFEDFKLLDSFGYIHPDDRNKVKRKFTSVRKNADYSDSIVYRIFRPNGELRKIRGFGYKLLENDIGKQVGLFIIENDITDKASQIEDDQQNNNMFKQILELNRHPILFTKNHQIVWVSQNWLNFFDYKMEEILEKPIEFLFTNQDEYAEYLIECNKKLKRDGTLDFNAILHSKNKKQFTVKMLTNALDRSNLSKGIVIVFVDIIERDITKKSDEGHLFYQSILQNYESIVMKIKENKIEWLNNAVEKLLLFDRNELLNEDLGILFQSREELKELINSINECFFKGRNFKGEIRCLRKDQKSIDFSITAINSQQENEGFVIVLSPISDLRSLVQVLRKEKNELEFYSDLLFHDVRNLSQDALSQLELSIRRMKNDLSESENRQKKSITEIFRISELIANMDIFFRVKRKEYELSIVDIAEYFKKASEKIIEKFEPRNIKFNNNLKSNNYFTKANEWLENIFFNILDNAVRYDKNKNAEIEIQISENSSKNCWQIEIADNGPGIGEELKENLFDRYNRGKGSIHGSGFGLTLVKAIVESYSGSISVEDRNPKNRSDGTKITIELPIVEKD